MHVMLFTFHNEIQICLMFSREWQMHVMLFKLRKDILILLVFFENGKCMSSYSHFVIRFKFV